jgi:hypothetical protein
VYARKDGCGLYRDHNSGFRLFRQHGRDILGGSIVGYVAKADVARRFVHFLPSTSAHHLIFLHVAPGPFEFTPVREAVGSKPYLCVSGIQLPSRGNPLPDQ